MKTALTIAGSDCSGGAGIQADIKTMTANGVYAMSVITALTAQNTMGVEAVEEVSPQFVKKQIDCVFKDIRPDAVKIGMVSSAGIIRTIAAALDEYAAENIVVDPVMVATSGSKLISDEAIVILESELFSRADIITPNIPEAETLCKYSIKDKNDMEKAAAYLGGKYGCAVLCKGGHSTYKACDVLYMNGETVWFTGTHVDTENTHGTGCTLSSAIASNMAKGKDIPEAVGAAKDYLTGALLYGLELGHGNGPLCHNYKIG